MDDARGCLHVVGAGDDDDLADLGGTAQAAEHLVEQQALLRSSVAGRRARRQDDRADVYLQPFSERQSRVTSCAYAIEALFGAPPAFATAVGPAL